MEMDRRIDDVRPAQGLEWEQSEAADRQDKDATIAALNQQLANMESALRTVGERCHGSSYLLGNDVHRIVIDALASHPAAPVQPEREKPLYTPPPRQDLSRNNHVGAGLRLAEAIAAEQAAPPVQQSGDVREAWEYSFTHSSALDKGDTNIGPCLTYDRSIAYGVGCFGQRQVVLGQALATTRPSAELVSLVNAAIGKAFADSPVNAIRAQDVIKPFLPELTRPSAALTDADFLRIADEIGLSYRTGKGLKLFARAILAASGGALAVPGWISVEDGLPSEKENPYQVAAICTKKYYEDSNYPGQGKRGIYQDWVLRRWPQNFTHWCDLPAAPTTQDTTKGGA